MGQQQLFLIILVAIIIGIATVVSLNVFGANARNANIDSVRQDMLTIATSGQAYYIKPAIMDGGGASFRGIKFNDVNFAADSIYSSGLTATNMNGTFVISSSGNNSFVVTAYPSSNKGYSKGVASGASMQATITNNSITWQKPTPQ